jgi:hypothetical protein
MLGELPKKIAVDLRAGFGRVNRQLDFLRSHDGRGETITISVTTKRNARITSDAR